MTGARRLFALQETDSEIDRDRRRLFQIEKALSGNPRLAEAQADLEARDGDLRRRDAELKEAEWDMESTQSRIKTLEGRMYGNQVRNPRELESMETEVAHLRERQSNLETLVLERMDLRDQAQEAAEAQRAIVRELEREWEDSQSGLVSERRRLRDDIPRLTARREEQAAALPEQARRTYEQLRSQKGGVAVARVERGVCSACRIAPPNAVVQRARADKESVFCASCGRILFVP